MLLPNGKGILEKWKERTLVERIKGRWSMPEICGPSRRVHCRPGPARSELPSKRGREGGRGAGADGYATARLPIRVRLALLRLPPSRRPRRPRRPRRFQLRRLWKLRRRATAGGGRPPVESGRRCSGQGGAAEINNAKRGRAARGPRAPRPRRASWGPLVAFALSAPPRWGCRRNAPHCLFRRALCVDEKEGAVFTPQKCVAKSNVQLSFNAADGSSGPRVRGRQ